MIKSALFPFITVCALLAEAPSGLLLGVDNKKQSVDFRDIHRDGTVTIIGNFGIPIGQIVTVEGFLAKPSKVTNRMTLRFTKINGSEVKATRWPPYIQVRNVDSLPKDVPIVVEGYEFLSWSGSPEINWLLEVDFVITKVISPDNLKPNKWTP